MNIAGINNTALNAVSRLDMDPNQKKIEKGLNENDYIHCKHIHLSRVLCQLFQDNIDLGTG